MGCIHLGAQLTSAFCLFFSDLVMAIWQGRDKVEGIPSSLYRSVPQLPYFPLCAVGTSSFLKTIWILWLGRRTVEDVMLTWNRQLQFPPRTGKRALLCHSVSCQL